MSTTIDSKVVEMKFDNKQFESGVQTSLSTLDKLKKSLNLSGAAKGLDNINAAASKVNFSGMLSGVEQVGVKFSHMQATVQHILNNIVDSAANTGKRVMDALTVEPVKMGLQEYETQINSVQTILANTSHNETSLDQVNSALDELNTYADKTIYNFTEMTRNVGTFTAAGVDLDTSVSAIKGIANLAAVSGSTSQQASTAMYQLSQALAAGKVSLMDWNSVVNAGMGGKVFQDALIRTSELLGTGAKKSIKTYGSFRESLTQGAWLTTEVLTETLNTFTGDLSKKELLAKGYTEEQVEEILKMGQTANDAATKVKTFTQLIDTLKESLQSGWTQTWEILIGDFEQAKELWSGVSDYFGEAIGKSAEARNSMLQGWADGGGREMAIDAIKNSFDGLLSILKPIKEAFREVFPPMTSKQLLEITENVRDLTAKFKLTDTQSKNLKSTFKGLFSAVDIGVEFFKDLVGGAVKLFGSFKGLGGSVLEATGSFGDYISNLRDSVKETDLFGKNIDGIVGFLQNGISKIKEFYGYLKGKMVTPGWEGFLNIMKSIWDFIKKIGGTVVEVGSTIGDALANAFRSGDVSAGLDVINGGILATILLGIKKFIGNISDTFEDAGGILSNITETLDSVRGCFEAYQQNLQANVLLKIAAAIGILAVAILLMATIDPDKLNSSLGAISMLFIELMGALAVFTKMLGNDKSAIKGAMVLDQTVNSLIKVSISILILAAAMQKVADMSWSEIGKGLTGVFGLMAIVVATTKLMSSEGKTVTKGAGQMILIALAMEIFADVCEKLGQLSWGGLAKSVVAIGGILALVAGFGVLSKYTGKMTSSSIALVIIGAAMEMFADVCSKFQNISWGALGKAGTAMAGVLVLAAGFGALSKFTSKMFSSSVALVIIGAAMEIFADVCSKFGSISWESLGKAGVAIGGILVLASGFALLSGLSSNMLGSVISLTIIAAAMEIFADVCNKFGSMKWEELGKAGAAIGGILVIVTAFTLLSGLAPSILSSAAALLVMSVSLSILTPVLTTLGGMSWGSIAKGLVAIAAAFVIIGVAGAVLGPISPAILAIAGSIALLGVACLAFGAGVSLVSTGLTLLATSVAGSATAIVAALTIIITGIAGLIPAVAQKIGEAIIVFCNVIAQGAPALASAIKAVILSLIDVLVECVPNIVEGLFKIVTESLKALATYTPQIVESLMLFLIGVINGVADNLPELIVAAVNLVMAFFQGVVDALSGIDTSTLLKGIAGVGLLSVMMIALAAVGSLAIPAMVGVLAMGAVIAELALVLAAIGMLAQIPGLSWFIGEGGDFLQVIGTAIGQFVGGIVGGIAEGATSTLPQVGQNLSDFMTNAQTFIEGAKGIDESILTGVGSLVGVILALTAADLVESLTSWITGGSSLSDFAEQLIPFGEAMAQFSSKVSGIDEGAVVAAANAGKIMAEMSKTLPNSGGVAGFFAGENDMSSFGAQLIPFGEAIVAFSKKVTGNINEESVAAAAAAGSVMATLANKIPNTGGLVSFFTGDNSMATFGVQLLIFGSSLVNFSKKISGNLNEEAITAASTAGNLMITLANKVPKTGGFVSWITGRSDLATFGDNLVSFGKSMVKFSDKVSGNIDMGAIVAANAAGQIMVSLSKSIPKSEGLFSSLAAKKDMKTFKNKLVGFGEAVVKFSEKVKGLNAGAISSSVSACVDLVKLTNVVKNVSPTGFSNLNKALSTFSVEVINKFINSFKTAENKLSGVGKNMTSNLVKGIRSGNPAIISAMSQIILQVMKNIKSKEPMFVNVGKELIYKFADSIHNNGKRVSDVFTSTLSSAASSIRNQYSNFYNSGAYLGQGLANGLESKRSTLYNKGYSLGQSANAGFKKAEDINSPSKVWYGFGQYMIAGLTNSLSDGERNVVKSSENLASISTDSFTEIISKLSDAISFSGDYEPTIRPVLDLSDVSAGASRIGDMLAMDPSVGVLANVGAIGSMMNRNQNGDSDALISAIDDLRAEYAASANGVTVHVELNYEAGEDANAIANDIATSLKRAIRRGI